MDVQNKFSIVFPNWTRYVTQLGCSKAALNHTFYLICLFSVISQLAYLVQEGSRVERLLHSLPPPSSYTLRTRTLKRGILKIVEPSYWDNIQPCEKTKQEPLHLFFLMVQSVHCNLKRIIEKRMGYVSRPSSCGELPFKSKCHNTDR